MDTLEVILELIVPVTHDLSVYSLPHNNLLGQA